MNANLLRVIIALGLSCSFAQADDLPDHDLNEWSVGETLFGEEAKLKKLRGQVVVIEYWGIG